MPPASVRLWIVLKKTFLEWLDMGVFHWGAALAYYAIFSLTPLLVLGITGLGAALGRATVRRQVVDHAGEWLGGNAQQVVMEVVDGLSTLDFSSFMVIPAAVMALLGATAVFANIQGALNHIWRLQPRSGIVRNLVRTRVASLLMILVLAGTVTLSVVLSTVVEALRPFVPDPLAGTLRLGLMADAAVTIVALWALLSLTFLILPDARISFRDVRVGAFFTALLLYLGKLALGFYFGSVDLGSAFGAAGSVFTLLVWIYYSAQIFFLGAFFTRVWADEAGASVEPEPYATFVETRAVSRGDPVAGGSR